MSVAGNTNAARHGAWSDRLIRSKAANHRRRFLRRFRLRAVDLDGIADAHLRTWSRAQARLDLWDEAGEPMSTHYLTAMNTGTRAMRLLEGRMRELGLDRPKPAEPTVADMLAERRDAR